MITKGGKALPARRGRPCWFALALKHLIVQPFGT